MTKVNKMEIIKMRGSNPCATLQKIGDKYGITRERVRQILHNNDKPTKHITQKYLCNNCSKIITGGGKLFCNRECITEYYRIELKCDQCGNKVVMRLSEFKKKIIYFKHQHVFCSRKCTSEYQKGKHNNKCSDECK